MRKAQRQRQYEDSPWHWVKTYSEELVTHAAQESDAAHATQHQQQRQRMALPLPSPSLPLAPPSLPPSIPPRARLAATRNCTRS